MDLSAEFALEERVEDLKSQNISASVVVRPAIREQLAALQASNLKKEIFHDDLESALAHANANAMAKD